MKDELLAGQALKKRYHWTYLVILTSVLLTYAIWLGSKAYFDDWYQDQFKYVAKLGSMGATILMCWSFILVTRFPIVERCLGGLDKAYQVHRVVGRAAFYLILLHPLFLAFHLLPDWSQFLKFFWFSEDTVRNTGILSLLGFAILVALSLWIEVARHIWKQLHNLFGPLLVLIIVHLVVADAEIMRFPLLTYWFVAWLTVALCCYLYIRVFYRFFGPLYGYEVVGTKEFESVLEVELVAKNRRRSLRHQPGQFIWVNFETAALRSEPHPFTISSPPDSETLRLSIKELGDWTAKLPKLQSGVRAQVWGPYGQFGDPLTENVTKEVVLIAGGIGITPFISMVEAKSFKTRKRLPTYLFYSVEDLSESYYHSRFTELDNEIGHFEYTLHRTDEKGFITADMIEEKVGGLQEKVFLICGPGPMLEALKKQFLEKEVSLDQIYDEDFSSI